MIQQFYNKNILEEVKITKLLPKVICALVISLFSINGHAWLWNSGDDANKETNKEVKVNQRMNLNLQDSALVKQQEEALKALQTEMNAKMQEITGDLLRGHLEIMILSVLDRGDGLRPQDAPAQDSVVVMERLDRRVATTAAAFGCVARDQSRDQRADRGDQEQEPQLQLRRRLEIPDSLSRGAQRLIAGELLEEGRL